MWSVFCVDLLCTQSACKDTTFFWDMQEKSAEFGVWRAERREKPLLGRFFSVLEVICRSSLGHRSVGMILYHSRYHFLCPRCLYVCRSRGVGYRNRGCNGSWEWASDGNNRAPCELRNPASRLAACSGRGQKAFAPSGRAAVMSEYRHVLLLHFHVNLDFGIYHCESEKRINIQNKETGQKDRAEHIDQLWAWRTPY